MSTGSPAQPASADAWVAAVHASEDDFEPLGAALVVAEDRVLTCAHVIMSEGAAREPLWVAFPSAGGCPRRRVASVQTAYSRPVRDLAVLVLEEPVPAGVAPAPLRCPKGQDLVSHGWWAFGFPDRDPIGDAAHGEVGASLAYGWVRLNTKSSYLIRPGFSGGGLWSEDYKAVVGIVGQAHANGDGRAITLHQADLDLPDLKLAALAGWSVEAAGEVALNQWGWALARDPEGVRHWRPRARGVSIESERGWRFRGRKAALTRIVSWLDRATPDRRVLVVTGSLGVGKSAVLGRIVTTADAAIHAALPESDTEVRATVGSVGCAVHAKGKTALEVAEEIARAASARIPEEPEDLAPALRDALGERAGSRFNVIIDALDEAPSPAQARRIVDAVVLPLAETCSDAGAQVVVGTRRHDDGGDLLSRFGPALDRLDLDAPNYFAEGDLAAYALACLQLTGDERPGNPYNDEALARPLAVRIAEVSGQNFLIAGLIARSHGLYDEQAADPRQLGFGATVDSALAGYLRPLPLVAGLPAADLFTALAFAEAPGLPAELWRLAIEALYGANVSAGDLARFARSSAANFLVETAGGATSEDAVTAPVYRLFHQALNDALLHARADVSARAADEAALTRAFLARGQASHWQDVPRYLLRSLPSHAQAGGQTDALLTDDAYLLHADLRRLLQVADDAASSAARDRARLLRLTPQAITAAPGERAALFSVTEVLDALGTTYRSDASGAPYKAEWAAVKPRSERAVFKGHQTGVGALCAVRVDGRDLLAGGCADGTVRLWDAQTGTQLAVLDGNEGAVNAVCAITVGGRELLASGGAYGTVRLWDPQTGEETAVLGRHPRRISALCVVRVDGRDLLASGGADGTVRLWDTQARTQPAVLDSHQGEVDAVGAITMGDRELLASGGADGTVRLWDPQTGEETAVLDGHQGQVGALCAVTVGGRELLASGGADGTVRLWDPQTGEETAVLDGHRGWVYAVCAVTVGGRDLLASGGIDATVRLWDPQTGEEAAFLDNDQGWVGALCAITVGGHDVLASGDADGTVRLWDPQTGGEAAAVDGHRGGVIALCAISVNGRDLLASGGIDGTVRLWDPRTGAKGIVLDGHLGWVGALCAVTVGGRELLASGGADGTVQLRDPQTGEETAVLEGRQVEVRGLCVISVDGRDLLAIGDEDGGVRLWDAQAGTQQAVLEGRQAEVRALCAVTVDGRDLLAIGDADGTVRLWDPRTGEERVALEKDHKTWAYAVCAVRVDGRDLLAIGGADGTVRLWDPRTGEQRAVLDGHQKGVNAMCAVTVGGGDLLASGSYDETVRLWDPQTGACMFTVPTPHHVLGLAWVVGSLAIGINSGILVIKPNLTA